MLGLHFGAAYSWKAGRLFRPRLEPINADPVPWAIDRLSHAARRHFARRNPAKLAAKLANRIRNLGYHVDISAAA
jgi:hypothetical protein